MAHKFAFESDNIEAQAISAVVVPELAQKYKVLGTPHMVVNGVIHLKGRIREGRLQEAIQSLESTTVTG